MGAEVTKKSDAVAETNSPAQSSSNFGIDLSDPETVKGIFKYDPRCELGPTGKLPEFDANAMTDLVAGKPVDVLASFAKRDGITLPGMSVTDAEGNVIATSEGDDKTPKKVGDETPTKAGDETPRAVLELNQNTLDAAKIRKKEGYHQVAERVLGKDFNQDEVKAFRDALKDSWKSDPENGNPNVLRRGDALLTQKNLDTVLNSVKDETLRNRIRERLTSAEFPPSDQPEKRKPNRERDEKPAPQRRDETKKPEEQPPRFQDLNPEPTVIPEARPDYRPDETRPSEDKPEGPFKSPFLRRYNEGDRFDGITSMYKSGRETASGLPFNKYELVAASREFPFGTVLKVTNPDNGKQVRVVVTDHGPFAGKKVERPDGSGEKVHNRVIDLSLGASNALGMGYTVKNLKYEVESIPEEGKWGKSRRNIHGDYRRRVQDDVRRITREHRGVNA